MLRNAALGAGGGVNITPTRIFLIAQKRRLILTRNLQYLLRHYFDVSHQNESGKIFIIIENSHFGSKAGRCLNTSGVYRFEVKRNEKKNTNNVKSSVLRDGHFGFSICFFGFDH